MRTGDPHSKAVQTQKGPEHQNRLQSILLDTAKKYINIPLDKIDESIHQSLKEIGQFVQADRAYVFDYYWEQEVTSNSYEWCEAGVEPQIDELQDVPIGAINYWTECHLKGDTMYIPDVLALAEDDGVRHILEPQGVKSLIAVPMMRGEDCVGFVGFDSVRHHYNYSEQEKTLLEVFAQIMVNIGIRKELEDRMILEKERAERASKIKSEFLANMSHEIRTPLNGVIGFGDLLNQTELNSVQRTYVDTINNSAKSLLGIINDILDFSKIEAGRLELEPVRTDIIDLVESSFSMIKYMAHQKQLELLLDLDANLPRFAVCDPVRVRQVLVNLLMNGVKFTEAGEVQMRVGFELIDEQKQIGRFRFEVKDTGIGIQEDVQKRLFQAFSQADTSISRQYGGTGLGLAISENLVRKMGGSIQLESTYGKGSTFWFEIELSYENGLSTQNLPDSLQHVLLVDDNQSNLDLLRIQLEHLGLQCEEADNGLDAVRAIKESTNGFDLVIIDYHMPYLDGLETVGLIRKNLKLSPDLLPIILLHSSSDDEHVQQKSKELGIRFRLAKPVNTRELLTYMMDIAEDSAGLQINGKRDEKSTTDGDQAAEKNQLPKVLIVEDFATNMLLAESLVKSIRPDAQIFKAENGLEGVQICLQQQPDLIFMDVQMPVMDGLEATRKIRHRQKEAGISPSTIIGLTAGALKEERERCFEAGMDDFLTKPVELATMREYMHRYLG